MTIYFVFHQNLAVLAYPKTGFDSLIYSWVRQKPSGTIVLD